MAQRRLAYHSWLTALPPERVAIPEVQAVDTGLYERLAGAAEPHRQDVAFLLFCATAS